MLRSAVVSVVGVSVLACTWVGTARLEKGPTSGTGPSVLVGGGTGFVGKHLVRRLEEEGYRVSVISRKAGTNTVTWDDIAKNGLPETDYVINLSGQNILDPMRRWSQSLAKELVDSRVDPTRLLVEAMKRGPRPKFFWATSAIGYYAPTDQPTPETGAAGDDFAATLCQAVEAAGAPADGLGVRYVAGRLGVVLGSDGGALSAQLPLFKLCLGGRTGSGKQPVPWIHIDDAVGLILHAMKEDTVRGPLNVVAPKPVTNAEFATALGRAVGRPTWIPMPEFAVKIIFGKERGSLLLEGAAVVPQKALDTGYRFRFPTLERALQDIV